MIFDNVFMTALTGAGAAASGLLIGALTILLG